MHASSVHNFWIDLPRKGAGVAQCGGWPYSVSAFVATENPKDYFHAERFAIGELNIRPHWIAQYKHDRDWEFLKLSDNPYAGRHWRLFVGHGRSVLDAPYLEGTGKDSATRDDEPK